MKKYTKKYIQNCYEQDKSVGGLYPEQDKIVRKALNEAEKKIYEKTMSYEVKNIKKEIINEAYEKLN